MNNSTTPAAVNALQGFFAAHPNSLPLAMSVEAFSAAADIGKTGVYEAMNSGALPAKKWRGRTLILITDAVAFLQSLPEYLPASGFDRAHDNASGPSEDKKAVRLTSALAISPNLNSTKK